MQIASGIVLTRFYMNRDVRKKDIFNNIFIQIMKTLGCDIKLKICQKMSLKKC